jgi:hypothetical protein
MAIAFNRPLTPETQGMFDGMDLHGTQQIVIPCDMCAIEYVLICPDSISEEQVAEYRSAIQMGMGNCGAHPPFIQLSF